VCRTLGTAIFDDVRTQLGGMDRMRAVELTQMWPFGLNHKEKFVMTRADAISRGGKSGQKLYVMHEHKSKWSPRNRVYDRKVLPRDAKQCFLNACTLALTTSVSSPLNDIQATCRYVTPTTFKKGAVTMGPKLYRHTFVLSAKSNEGGIHSSRSAMLQAIAGMKKYVDPVFICEDTMWYARIAAKVNRASRTGGHRRLGPMTDDDPLLRYTACARIACMGLPQIHHNSFINGTPFRNRNKRDTNSVDKSWWPTQRNDGEGVRLKRAQMGQAWRTNHGRPVFKNANQTVANRAFGGAPTSRPQETATVNIPGAKELADGLLVEVNALGAKMKVSCCPLSLSLV